jgi:type I restriction enzyme, S subunit
VIYEVVKLGEICSFLNGGTPSRSVARYFEGEIPWITSADLVDDQDVVTDARFFITEEAIESSATKIVPKNNILLVSRTGVGKVAITGVDICISQDFTGIVPNKSRVDLRYLFRFLQSCKSYFIYHQRGATIKGITRQVITDLELPVPPLGEQQRIAAILDKADALRAKRRAALAKLDTLLQATFLHMFGELLTSPKKVPLTKLIILNPRKSEISSSLSKDKAVTFLPMSAVGEDGSIDLSETKMLSEVWTGYTYFAEGDVLFAKITPCMENGKGTIAKGLTNSIGFGSTEFHVLRPTQLINAEWLHALTSLPSFRLSAERK